MVTTTSTTTADPTIQAIETNPFVANGQIQVNDKAATIDAAPDELKASFEEQFANSPDHVFPLQSETWSHMQVAVKAGLKLPIADGDFTTKYGTFEDTADVQGAIQIFKDLNALLDKFGDATSISTEINKYTSMTTPPDAIFAHSIWLSQQTSLAAQKIQAIEKDLGDFLNDPSLTTADKVEALKELVTDSGGIRDKANEMAAKCSVFNTQLADYFTQLSDTLTNTEIGGPPSLARYLANENNVLKAAQAIDATLTSQITDLTSQLAEANTQYIAFTATACAAPILSLLPPLFFIQAVIDAAVFGSLAGVWKGKVDSLNTQLAQAQTEEQKKAQLVLDIGQLNTHAEAINVAGIDFLNAVSKLEEGWTTLTSDLNALLANTDEATLAKDGTFSLYSALKGASQAWDTIIDAADTFRSSGFIIASTTTT
jgi:hypothetical protein